ncbi:MAG: hypothetical protein Q8M16_18725 [Pirellulaceae bacterium]|nr:hypothetical protein [Pirellulaceae bacterium]
MVIADRIGRLEDLRTLLDNANAARSLETVALQLSWHNGYGIDPEYDFDDWPEITTLFLDYYPDQREASFEALSCWTNLKRVVLIARPSGIEELTRMDPRCDAIFDGPVNLSEILRTIEEPTREWQQTLKDLPFEIIVAPVTTSNDEKVELIWTDDSRFGS